VPFLSPKNCLIVYLNISMISINLMNVESLIFSDKKVQALLPEFQNTFQRWEFAKVQGLSFLVQNTTLEFLNLLAEPHIQRLEAHFNTQVTIDKIDPCIVKNLDIPISKTEDVLCDIDATEYKGFALHRKEDQLYISFWR
jgi:hypothetical protein